MLSGACLFDVEEALSFFLPARRNIKVRSMEDPIAFTPPR